MSAGRRAFQLAVLATIVLASCLPGSVEALAQRVPKSVHNDSQTTPAKSVFEKVYCIGDNMADASATKCGTNLKGSVKLQCKEGSVTCEGEVIGSERTSSCYTGFNKDGTLNYPLTGCKVAGSSKPPAPTNPTVYCIGDRIADVPATKCSPGTKGSVKLQCKQGSVACEGKVLGLDPIKCYTPTPSGTKYDFTDCKVVGDSKPPAPTNPTIYCIGDRIADAPATKCSPGTKGPVKLRCKQGGVACEGKVLGLEPIKCYTPTPSGTKYDFTDCSLVK